MAPRPSENFAQAQPITTTLRNICEYYATNTCLKELLQNADDAGASEIEYVLDTNSYTDVQGPFLHETLVGYHGPALLVRNNSSFTNDDFASLASVGDSLKRHDIGKTGKFGQGFNSVYHWTDGPWIYSRTKLLMLDPHESWSKETGMPGGPAWDVVKDDCIEVQNHMKTFGSFNDLDFSKGFDQTIIRIPLRTKDQAKMSKIVGRATTVNDIKKAFEEFGDEMKEGGLLFLKSICKMIIRIDNNVAATIEIVDNGSNGLEPRNKILTDFKRMYAAHGPDLNKADIFCKNFELSVKYSAGPFSSIERYLIQHNMRQSSGEPDLDEWARTRKLFPWTAIAAPLNDTNSSFRGRLYTVLRLPILTNHPVHIHGLWSIVPDRGRLSSSGESSSFENRWNKFMFKSCVSNSWTKLLLHQNKVSLPNEITFSLWPKLVSEPTDIWSMLDEFVIDEIIEKKAPVWNTSSGCIPIDRGFFSAEDGEHEVYASALAQIQFPAIFAPLPLLNKTKQRAIVLSVDMQMMKPSNVRNYIQQNHPPLLPDSSPYLLEFCLLDAISCSFDGKLGDLYRKMQDVKIWPILSTSSLSRLDESVLLPRNLEEMKLFQSSTAFQTINLMLLTNKVKALLKRDVALIQKMRHRDLDDLKLDWPQMYHVTGGNGGSEQLVPRNADADSVLRSVWDWICEREFKGHQHPLFYTGNLWLLPVKGYYIRLLAPPTQPAPMLVAKRGEPFYDLMLEIWSRVKLVNNNPPVTILDAEILPAEATQFLMKQTVHNPGVGVACIQDFESFVTWLSASRESLARISDQNKVLLLIHLVKILRDSEPYILLERADLRNKVKALPFFRKPQFGSSDSSRVTTRCDINGCSLATEVPPGLPQLPVIPEISFFDPSNDSEKYLLKYFGLLETMTLETLLQNYLLPWAVTAQDQDRNSKKDLIDFLFRRATGSFSWVTLVAKFPIIPLDMAEGSNDQTQYRYLADVVHSDCLISKLYFARENVFPDPAFFKKHRRALEDLGIKCELTWPDMVKRIQEFSRCTIGELGDKVDLLLALPVPHQDHSIVNEIRTLKWIPGTRPGENSPSLLAPNECRPADMASYTDFVLGVTRFRVNAKWSNLLGWDEPIDDSVKIRQLDECLVRKLHTKIEEVLRHIRPSMYPELRSKSCVRSKYSKDYREPKIIFRPGSLLTKYPMAPLLDEVDPLFEENHLELIEALNIRKEPSLEDIIDAQETILAASTSLNPANLRIIIASLEIAICLHQPEELSGILVPDLQGKLRKLPDIVHGDRNVSGDASTFNFVHTTLSRNLVDGLGVENSLARATRLGIIFEDEDEDEYTPREKLTTVISDTLGRYTIESTFTEFLANAEDSEATRISWIVDECQDGPYDSKSLLTPELAHLQGPSLFVHNDQVFSVKDFDGFKNIGLGSKSDDATSTGMFGRGALSMYHFTDVPMIVSGSSLLILDPQQELLPRNKHYRRKAGVKMSLSDALRQCPDQLAPFHGLCGYAQEDIYYDGTLFRFPFRRSGKTALKENEALVSTTKVKALLDNYQDAGQVSLLFLQKVKNIEVSIRGQEIAQWKVSRTASEEAIFHTVKVNIQKGNEKSETKIWRVGLTDVDECPADIVKPGRGSKKITTCGIAACLSDPDMKINQKIFCTLPTPLPSQLPVAFHASFAMSSDRRGIHVDDSIGQSIIPKWNKWLLASPISKLYVDFLEDIARSEGEDAFRYWPIYTPNYTMTKASKILSKAFWDVLQDSDCCVLPLSVSEPSSNLVRRLDRIRKLHPTTSFKSAKLDIFPAETSQLLRPLFLEMFASSLVCVPEGRLQRDMGRIKSAKKVDGDSLRNLIRDGPGFICLTNFLNRSTEEKRGRILKELLGIIVPQSKEKALKDLDGCTVLPLLDGSLGRLSFKPQKDDQWYFVASSVEEFELFRFASGCFVNTMTHHYNELIPSMPNPLQQIIEGPFNIRSMGLGDIAGLLAKAETSAPGKSPFNDNWLPKFWDYLKAKSLHDVQNGNHELITDVPDSNHELMKKLGLLHYPIYRTKCGEEWIYSTPQQFEDGRCVIEPCGGTAAERDQLQTLYMDLSDLVLMADSNCFLDLPDKLHPFTRLIRVLDRITLECKEPINQYLGRLLTPKSRKVLRNLMLKHLVSNLPHASMVAILRDLPVWPNVGAVSDSQRDVTYVSAADGYFCSHRAMLMPWLSGLDRFVDPKIDKASIALKKLNITSMSVSSVWDHVAKNYPETLPSTVNLDQYRELIVLIANAGLLPAESIAIDGNKKMCQPSSLYDHKDAIFSAAFREEKSTRFLHSALQLSWLHDYWCRLHLRRSQVEVDSLTLINCARAISTRMSDNPSQELFQDANIVAEYLFTQSWPEKVRYEILSLEIFPVREDVSSQKAFRQERMRALAALKSHVSLEDVGRQCDERILWSQVPFLRNPAGDVVLRNQLLNDGAPPAAMVFQHLEYLVNVRNEVSLTDVVEYLKDIQATYAYLQEEAASTKLIPEVRETAVWANLEISEIDRITIQDFESSLTPAKLLCMNCPADPLPIKVARKFLVPYEQLLRSLGCPTVWQPEENKLPSSKPSDDLLVPMASAMAKIRHLRDQHEFVDVIFEAEGQWKPAHRIFMVAVSDYCKAQFAGVWGRLLEPQKNIRLEDMTFKALSQMVDYAYTGEVRLPMNEPEDNEELATQLDECLELLEGANRWLIDRVHTLAEEHVLNRAKKYVRPDNVIAVRDRALEVRAARLVEYCDEFIKHNHKILDLYESSSIKYDDGESGDLRKVRDLGTKKAFMTRRL